MTAYEKNKRQATKVFAKAGLDNETSAMCYYRQRFRLDVHYSTLVHIFNFSFSIEHLYRAGRTMNSLPSQILERCLPCSTDIQLLSSLRLTAHDSFSIGLTQQQFIGITFFSFSTGTVNRRLKKMAGHHLQTLTS